MEGRGETNNTASMGKETPFERQARIVREQMRLFALRLKERKEKEKRDKSAKGVQAREEEEEKRQTVDMGKETAEKMPSSSTPLSPRFRSNQKELTGLEAYVKALDGVTFLPAVGRRLALF